MEYTVIGDSVNLASRLESNAKPGQILISGRTYEMVRRPRRGGAAGPDQGQGQGGTGGGLRAGRAPGGRVSAARGAIAEHLGARARRWARWRCSRAPAPTAAPSARRRGPRRRPAPRGRPPPPPPRGSRLPEAFRVRRLHRHLRASRRHRGDAGRAPSGRRGQGLDDRGLHGHGQLRRGRGSDHPRAALESRRRGARRLPARAHPRAITTSPRQAKGRLVLARQAFEEQMRYLKARGLPRRQPRATSSSS